MQFTLYDRWGNWKSPMDGIADYLIDHNYSLGTLELTLVGNTVQPAKEDRILFKDGSGWNEVLVTGVETADDDQGRYTSVYCEDSISELRRKDIETLDSSKTSNLLGALIDNTIWNLGIQGSVEDFKVEEITALEALYDLAEAQNGIIKTEISVDEYRVVARTVSIVQPDTYFCGIRFDYGRNINSIKRIIEEDDVYTKIIARGGAYTATKQVWDETIQDWLWKTVTEHYTCTVEDDALLSIWGWPTKTGIRHSEFRWTDDTISNEKFSSGTNNRTFMPEVQAELEAAAKKQLAANGARISYEASVELFDQDINVGQLAQIVDVTFEPPLALEGTVIQTTENPDGKTVVFGTIASTIADTILNQQKSISTLSASNSSLQSTVISGGASSDVQVSTSDFISGLFSEK